MKKDLLKLTELSREEIFTILDLADQLKYDVKNGIPHRQLEGKVLAMVFAKNSTRTRASFETGMFQLGGHAIYLTAADTQAGRGEPVKDTARALSRYCDGIMVRTFDQRELEELARYATVPVINGMTDSAHPCQALSALMTIREEKALLDGLKLCYVGDGNNVCSSLIVGCLKVGMEVSVACPEGYEPPEEVLRFAECFGAGFQLCRDPKEAVRDADVVYTDVWTSMGQEDQAARRQQVFGGVYQVSEELLSGAKENAMVLHCLPAHRGQEITDAVMEAHAKEIFEEAENRLHAQKAVLCLLMGA
ncbi:MAG: ornithine carbamoyltransferase [Oscillospiraceae bacterium]|nr:ornithine carbamoyltransferase [Oscillospiraceae bacterium]